MVINVGSEWKARDLAYKKFVTLIACFKNRGGGGATPGSDDFNGSGPLNNIKTPKVGAPVGVVQSGNTLTDLLIWRSSPRSIRVTHHHHYMLL